MFDLDEEPPTEAADDGGVGALVAVEGDALVVTRQRGPRERNTRLQAVMVDRRVSYADLAQATGRNLKTAQRWVYEGRVPRAKHAEAVARYLDVDPNWLWPRLRAKVNPELINLYAHIGEVPSTIWVKSATDAERTIDIAADTAPVLPHDVAEILAAKARAGVQVRLCLSALVVSTVSVNGAWTRISASRHMLGIYRFDDEMLVWLNREGSGIQYYAPALHLRWTEEYGVFDFYRTVFTRLWEDGEAIASHGKDWYRANG